MNLTPANPLLLLVPLALSLLALGLAWLAHTTRVAAQPGDLAGQIDWLLSSAEAAQRDNRPPENPVPRDQQPQYPDLQYAAPEPHDHAPPPGSPLQTPSPLQLLQSEFRDDVLHLRDQVEEILRAAGTASSTHRAALDRFQSFADQAGQTPNPPAIADLAQELVQFVTDLIRKLLPLCDLELDPGHTDERIQAPLRRILSFSGLTLVVPRPGDPIDPRTQTRMGIAPAGPPGQRGTVAQVRCRGLKGPAGELLLKPEVLEYD